jgi:hypothetical protein
VLIIQLFNVQLQGFVEYAGECLSEDLEFAGFIREFLLCRFQWPLVLRHGSTAARLLELWVRIPPGHGCRSLVTVVCCQEEVSASG